MRTYFALNAWMISPGLVRVFEPCRFLGPVRLQVEELNVVAESSQSYCLKPEVKDGVNLRMQVVVMMEPKYIVQRHGMSIEECLTSSGTDLVQRIPPVNRWEAGLPGHSKPDDPRCTGDYEPAMGPQYIQIQRTIPLQPADVAKGIAPLRFYYAVETFEDPNRVEISDLAKPSMHKLPDGLTIEWQGVQDVNGRRELTYRALRDGGLTASDREMLCEPRVAVLDAHGERLMMNTWKGSREGNDFMIGLRPDQTPAKALISLHPKVYAGIVEFRDIPMPELPDVP